MPPKILVISGPTASGKTGLAIALAKKHGGEVVSADSMQIYRHMDIGTAKPSAQEMQGVAHHMLDVAEPEENFSVARYVDMANACIADILSRNHLPIIAGGTGLYIDSLLSGRSFAAFTPDSPLRKQLQQQAKEQGAAALLAQLAALDPVTAARLHENDEKRIIRALEVYHTTGIPISVHNARTKALPPPYDALHLTLSFAAREDMWTRINRRVDQMLEDGLVQEVQQLLKRGIPPTCTAMQAIGYKELAAALQGDGDVQKAAEEIKLRTRQYAKRQLTWFRRNEQARAIIWEEKPNIEEAVQISTQCMVEFGISC